MAVKAPIEHNPQGWIEIFTSANMQAVVDQAGQRIASEAGSHFGYEQAKDNRYTVAGFVSGDSEGAILEATDKVLTKAVHK
ncbi:MAG: hypothetical protein Q4C03_01435 [bacterium]|nr:hypothetical protein [bacterium]